MVADPSTSSGVHHQIDGRPPAQSGVMEHQGAVGFVASGSNAPPRPLSSPPEEPAEVDDSELIEEDTGRHFRPPG
jgi:hypothetical protein